MKFMAPMFATLCDRRMHDHNTRSMSAQCMSRRPQHEYDRLQHFNAYQGMLITKPPNGVIHRAAISFKRRDLWC